MPHSATLRDASCCRIRRYYFAFAALLMPPILRFHTRNSATCCTADAGRALMPPPLISPCAMPDIVAAIIDWLSRRLMPPASMPLP